MELQLEKGWDQGYRDGNDQIEGKLMIQEEKGKVQEKSLGSQEDIESCPPMEKLALDEIQTIDYNKKKFREFIQ